MTRFILILLCAAGCGSANSMNPGMNENMNNGGTLKLTSSAFAEGATMALKYAEAQSTCGQSGTMGGMNLSPPLSWSGAPSGTQSFALLMDDLYDEPLGFVLNHWMVWDIPASVTSLSEGAASSTSYKKGGEYGNQGNYLGPCPPAGESHPYRFKIYALSVSTLGLQSGLTDSKPLRSALADKTLAEATLIGHFKN